MLHILNRGDSTVLEKTQYAATYNFGGTTVHIDDSQVAKTEEEKNVVLGEVRKVVLAILEEKAIKKAK